MMTKKEYRIASMEFRRIASNMLMADFDNATTQLTRFKQYIDSSSIISNIIERKISGVEHDFKQCFLIDNTGWNEIRPPVDEACHLRAQYDYISYLCTSEADISNVAFGFAHGSSNLNQIVRDFLEDAFKHLVDFVIDSLSKEIMLSDEDKPSVNTFTQNIDKNYGTINTAGRDVNSFSISKINDINELKDLIEKLIQTIPNSTLSVSEKEDLTDDLDTISEQLESSKPKISRIRKAYENIKCFVTKTSKGAELAGMLVVDWHNLISKLEAVISNISQN